jgi:hypothetical protein
MRMFIAFRKSGAVETPGVDYGPTEFWQSLPARAFLENSSLEQFHNEMERLNKLNTIPNIVLKVKGSMHFAGRGEQKYGGTEFVIFKILDIHEDQHGRRFLVDDIAEIPVRRS